MKIETKTQIMAPVRHLPFEVVSLVRQGGGALGAYQAGVYEALAEADIHPNWIAEISIGAINAAIITGNRLPRTRARAQTAGAVLLQRIQGRGAPSDQVARGRVGRPRRPRQRGGADLHSNPAQRIRQEQPADVRCLDRRYASGPDGGGR